VCGRRIVEEVLRRHPGRVESMVYAAGGREVADDLESLAAPHGGSTGDGSTGDGSKAGAAPLAPEILMLSPALFREIDPVGVEPPLAVVRFDPPPPWDAERERRGLTLFLPLGDPENVGAAIRSALAFEVDRVVLLAEAAHPFLPRAIRAAAGACFDVVLRAGPPLDELAAAVPGGFDLCVLDRDGEPLDGIDPAPDRGLLVGEEGRGAPAWPELRRVSIPISARVESLNAAVAVGIALWELRRARSA